MHKSVQFMHQEKNQPYVSIKKQNNTVLFYSVLPHLHRLGILYKHKSITSDDKYIKKKLEII